MWIRSHPVDFIWKYPAGWEILFKMNGTENLI